MRSGSRKNQKIDMEKWLISIIWFVNRIYSLPDVPEVTTYNNAFICDYIVIQSKEELISTIRQIFDEIPREAHFCLSFMEKVLT
jgi:hypothetical protein